MISQRLAGAPMENNGILAEPGDTPGTLTCWISHQAPHSAHGAISAMLGMEPGDLRVICPWVGGGFGPKAAVYPEYLVAAAACRALGAPVKWAETRSEDMVSLVHGRDYVMTAKLGVTKDGKITGLEGDVTANAGSYPAIGAILPMLTQMMSVGVYDIDKVKFATRSVVTNTTTVGAYRGAGRPEATQLIERVMDVAAQKIGMDPAELRRRNFIQPDKFPLTTNTGAALRLWRVREGARRRLGRIGLHRASCRAGPSAGRQRSHRARHRRVVVRGSHRSRRSARRVRRHGDPRRRHRQRLRRHQRARAGPPHRVRHARLRGTRDPDGSDQVGQLRHRSCATRLGHAGFAFAADGRFGDLRRLQRGVEPRPEDRCAPPRGGRRRHRRRGRFTARRRHPVEVDLMGRARGRVEAMRRSSPMVSIPRSFVTSSTSTAPTRRSRSAPTCRSSRSTPRPARSSCVATSPSTTAAES